MRLSDTSGNGQLPLTDVKVVDLTQIAAGPFATMILGDFGAEVIKLEAVGRGDRSRSTDPSPKFFDALNRNKRSVAVNLKSEQGQSVVKRLLSDADVFIQNMKPGRIEKFNLAYEDVVDINPNLIYCSVTGFGSGSPYENVPAFDMLIQAMSGIMSMTGEADGPPTWSGLPSGDLAAALYAAQSIIVALYAQERGDIDGEWIEVPMYDAAISLIGLRIAYTFGHGEPFPRLGNSHPLTAPFGTFECDDGTILIAAGTETLWKSFCEALDCVELLDDERFETSEKRVEHRMELRDHVEPILASDTVEAWSDTLQSHQVPAGPIHDTESLLQDEHVQERKLHRRMERPGRSDADMIDNPVHFRNLCTELSIPPQLLGEETETVLSEYGYSDEEIADLQDSGAVE